MRSVSKSLTAILLLALAYNCRANEWDGDVDEELDGALYAISQGIKLVLNPSRPKLTIVSTNATCVDGTPACSGQFLATALQKLYETTSAGSQVKNRKAGDVLDLAKGSWVLAQEDLSAKTDPPLSNVTTAVFTAPFRTSIPPCSPASTFVPGSPQSFAFKVLLFPSATNFTVDGEEMEVLSGNVKTLLEVSGWPFCSASDTLVGLLALKSTKLGSDASRDVSVVDGTEANEQVAKLAEKVFNAVGGGVEAVDVYAAGVDGGSQRRRQLLNQDDGQGGMGLQGSAGRQGGQGQFRNATAGQGNDDGNVSQRMGHWEAVGLVSSGHTLNSTTLKRLEDKLAAQRPVAGLGRRDNMHRLFMALPGSGDVDVKLDVPTTALVDGAITNITVTAPPRGNGQQAMQFVQFTFPSFQALSYDPTSSFATSDLLIDAQLIAEFEGTNSAPSSTTRAAGWLLCMAATATAAFLL